MILIASVSSDVHAMAVKRELDKRGVACEIFPVDQVAHARRLSVRLSAIGSDVLVWPSNCTSPVPMSSVSLIWLRRFRAEQVLCVEGLSEIAQSLINNESRGAAMGALTCSFSGRWISNPEATLRASDKLYQLKAAAECGFAIPETLVSQERDEVEAFHCRHNGRIIVKSIVGVEEAFLLTRGMPPPSELEPAAFSACPALYQENIPGTRHVRLLCFGDTSLAALIESQDLDWRPNLDVPVYEWKVPDDVHAKARAVLDRLGLAMGVMDLKLTDREELVWLEVNPQGQFLFLEPLTSMRIAERFAGYLAATARLA